VSDEREEAREEAKKLFRAERKRIRAAAPRRPARFCELEVRMTRNYWLAQAKKNAEDARARARYRARFLRPQ